MSPTALARGAMSPRAKGTISRDFPIAMMESLATWTGWAAVIVMIAAASLPLAARVASGVRAPVDAPPIRRHVVLGMGAALLGFLHPLTALFSLGSEGAIGGGVIALGLGALAFVVLLAHTGIGLKLRDPKLRKREASRARHFATAITIVALALAHALACRFGG